MDRFRFACGVLLASMLWLCVVSEMAYPNCDPAQAYQIGDGRCNGDFNNEACGYDGGDCCECICQDSDLFECGTEGFNCLDPDAPCHNGFMFEEALDVRILLASLTPTWTPTSSPTLGEPSPGTTNNRSSDDGQSSQDAGIIVGCVIGALVVIGAIIYIRKRRGLSRDATSGYYPASSTLLA